MQRDEQEELYEDHVLVYAEATEHRGRLERPSCRHTLLSRRLLICFKKVREELVTSEPP